MNNALSVLGTGVYLPPSQPVRDIVAAAGQDPSGHQGWDNCCHALEGDHPSTMGITALRSALEDANVDSPVSLSWFCSPACHVITCRRGR